MIKIIQNSFQHSKCVSMIHDWNQNIPLVYDFHKDLLLNYPAIFHKR